MTFSTRIWNRRSDPVKLVDQDGNEVETVGSGQIIELVSVSDRTTFAPFEEIIFEREGYVNLSPRPKWVPPYFKEPWEVTIENLHGKDVERIELLDRVVAVMKGIPVTIWVDSLHTLARFSRITIRTVSHREPSPKFPGYFYTVEGVKNVPTLRPQRDLDQIENDIKASKGSSSPLDSPEEPAKKPAPSDTAKEN